MKTLAVIVFTTLLAGCASKPVDEWSCKSWSLQHHLETRSEWGAVQGGISARLRQSEHGIVLVIRNDGQNEFELEPFFMEGFNIEIEAYDDQRMALSDIAVPTFVFRTSELVRLKPRDEFVSPPIEGFDTRYTPPAGTAWLVAVWYRNELGTELRGPVVTGPLAVR